MPRVVYGSRVYQYKSKNNWKESWLSLDESGTLTWKRKDAFLPLASVKLTEVLDKIKIGDAWHDSDEKSGKEVTRPFFLVIPIRPSRPSLKLALLHGADMDLWLEAFATVVAAKPLYKSIKAHSAGILALKNGTDPEAVENSLAYKDLIRFYKNVWQEFLEVRSGKGPSKTAFIEERVVFHDLTQGQHSPVRKALSEDTFKDPLLNGQKDNSTIPMYGENGHRQNLKSENGHPPPDHSIQAIGSHLTHTNATVPLKPLASVSENGHGKINENGQPRKVSLVKNGGGHDMATLAGKARLEWYAIENTNGQGPWKQPNLFVTTIRIDHYPNQCGDKETCVMHLNLRYVGAFISECNRATRIVMEKQTITTLTTETRLDDGNGHVSFDACYSVGEKKEAKFEHTDPRCACLEISEDEKRMAVVPRIALSLSGCGFLGVYHFGSIVCFRKHGRQFLERCDRFAGASAGSLVSAMLVTCPDKMQDSLVAWYTLASEVMQKPLGALTTDYSLIKRVEAYVDSILPMDAHKLASGRLFVSVTCREMGTNSLVSEFESRESLIKHLVGSCYIPFYGGVKISPLLIEGKEFVDGGLSCNLPKFTDRRTITISPFSGEADISPEDGWAVFDWRVTFAKQSVKVSMGNVKRGMQALFPPSMSVLEDYYKLGFVDTMKFLLRHGCFEREEGTPV